MFLVYINDSRPPTNVRSGPGTGYEKIGTLDNETLVTAKQALDNGWLEIEKPIAGYIAGNLTLPKPPRIFRDTVGSIAIWQHLLNGCGYHPNDYPQLVITGKFDAETIAVTKKFQLDLGLEETGDISDIRTWQAAFDHDKLPGWLPIESPIDDIVEIPANNLTEAEKYDYCRQVVLSHGGNFRDGQNRRNLLAFRKETSTTANKGKGLYDDWIFMIWKDAYGYKHCCKYQSNTEPSSWYEDNTENRKRNKELIRQGKRPIPLLGVDAGGDSRKDLGCLPEGYYTYRVGSSSNLGKVLRPTKEATNVVRDIDHDGRFELGEPTASAGYSMLFHKGFSWRTGSAGCQTMKPDVYDSFWGDLTSKGDPGVIGYTIVRWKSL
jgi:hypothetical protein